MAIGIKIKKVGTKEDISKSKFFGTPTLPKEIADEGFEEDEIFFFQISLEDIAPFDKQNKLPHEGYLYIFLKTEDGDYDLKPIVRYSKIKPTVALDCFNDCVEGYSHLINDRYVEFYECEDDKDCTRFLGVPSDWNYQDEPPRLLFQFDPLDGDLEFLTQIDGFIYFFFEESGELERVFIHEEFS